MIDWDKVRAQVRIQLIELEDLIDNALNNFAGTDIIFDHNSELMKHRLSVMEKMIQILNRFSDRLDQEMVIRWIYDACEQADLDGPYDGFFELRLEDLAKLFACLQIDGLIVNPNNLELILDLTGLNHN